MSHAFLLEHHHQAGVQKHSQSLPRGLNFVISLNGIPSNASILWIDGRDIQPGVKVLSGPFDLTQISPHVTPDTKHRDCDPFCNARLLDIPEPSDSEEAPDICVTYCTTLAVEYKLKKTSIAEIAILGNIRDMTNEDDTLLEEAADTTAKQLADGWLTWAESQQTPVSTQPVKNSEQVEENCVLDSCAPKQWQLSVQKKRNVGFWSRLIHIASDFFHLERGVRQGCPLSGILFVIGIELLARALKRDPTIQGITIGQKEIKITQYADDTTVLLKDLDSVLQLLKLLDQFKRISGLEINVNKTEAMWLGSWRNRKDKPFGFKWGHKPIYALGIHFFYDLEQANSLNFKEKARNLGKEHTKQLEKKEAYFNWQN